MKYLYSDIFSVLVLILMLSKVHYQGSLLRPWLQKMAVFRGQGWHLDPHSPVLIKISADKRPLNQLTVKKLFFSLIIKTFCHYHHHIVHEKTITLSVWMKEICTLLVKLHIICSRMQRVNQHAIEYRPSIIQVGCPTCCYQVCAPDHANVGTADLDYSSGHCHRNDSYSYSGFVRICVLAPTLISANQNLWHISLQGQM